MRILSQCAHPVIIPAKIVLTRQQTVALSVNHLTLDPCKIIFVNAKMDITILEI
jgi:hypothetical protein